MYIRTLVQTRNQQGEAAHVAHFRPTTSSIKPSDDMPIAIQEPKSTIETLKAALASTSINTTNNADSSLLTSHYSSFDATPSTGTEFRAISTDGKPILTIRDILNVTTTTKRFVNSGNSFLSAVSFSFEMLISLPSNRKNLFIDWVSLAENLTTLPCTYIP